MNSLSYNIPQFIIYVQTLRLIRQFNSAPTHHILNTYRGNGGEAPLILSGNLHGLIGRSPLTLTNWVVMRVPVIVIIRITIL